METFAAPREFVEDTGYSERRVRTVSALAPDCIDAPIRDLILGFAGLSHCFTLQSCYGHFLYTGQGDPQSVNTLPEEDIGPVRYRIAYLALCIENGATGGRLRGALQALAEIDPEDVQFGSPGWFWEQHPNSYALQVEPGRFKQEDEAVIGHSEALHIQQVRDEFFEGLRGVLAREKALARRG